MNDDRLKRDVRCGILLGRLFSAVVLGEEEQGVFWSEYHHAAVYTDSRRQAAAPVADLSLPFKQQSMWREVSSGGGEGAARAAIWQCAPRDRVAHTAPCRSRLADRVAHAAMPARASPTVTIIAPHHADSRLADRDDHAAHAL